MSKIVPTITTNNIDFFHRFETVYSTFAQRIQVNICDNKFIAVPTISENDLTLSKSDSIIYDFHMLVKKPSEHIDRIIELHPNLAIFHAECDENLLPIFEKLKTNGIKSGIALLKTTYPGKIKPYIEAADHALVFARQLGQQGKPSDMMQIEKIPIIKSINENIEIGWEGGVSISNIRELAHSDIDIVNVGSLISKSKNPAQSYQELVSESEKNGVFL